VPFLLKCNGDKDVPIPNEGASTTEPNLILSNSALNNNLRRAINFVFLVEAEYQTGGLQGQIEDQAWDCLCSALSDPVPPLSNEVVLEAHKWAHQLAQNKPEAFAQLLDGSPPHDRTLRSVLTKMADTTQLWNTKTRNEDTYLKSQLGPFLDSYFGKLRYTKSDW